MKTNNVILTSMKKSMKYICLFLMLLGIHVNAWGTGATTLNPTNLQITTSEQTDKCFVGDVLVDYVKVGTYDSKLTIKKDATIQNITPVAGKITSIVVSAPTYSGATSGNFVIYGGATAGAKTTAIYSGTSTSEITADFSSYNYQYFYIENNTERQVTTASIVINYSGTESGNLIVYPNTFEIEGELDDGEFSASGQGKFYINTDVLAGEASWNASAITSGDEDHCDVNAVFPDAISGYSVKNNFTLTIYADAAGTYEATITISGYDLDYENDLSTTLTVTVTITAPCTSRSITMSNFSKDFGSADFVPTHTVSAGSGTKTWTSSNTDVATIVDGKVHIVASGTSTIELTVAEADPYCEVSQSCTMTVNALVPTVTAFTGTSSSTTSITLTNAQVSNKGGAAISAYGYIYSTTASTAETLKIGETGVSTATVASADIAASTNFASKTVSGLTTGTTYYVRAYATNSAGTGYSAVQSVKTIEYTDYTFSCAELTLTPKLVTASTPIFVTSTANKTVRSQDSILIVGNGLTPSQALEFPDLPSKFTIKSRANGALSTKADGTIDTVAYIFYTPGSGDTEDGLDKLTGISVKVGGTKPRQVNLKQDIIGRHLPADFVIAAKKNGKWWALPSNMTTGTPAPAEIAVDDYNNPSIAYTATTNIYSLYDQAAGRAVKLAMRGQSDAPLYGSTGTGTGIGKSSATIVTNPQSEDYLWLLTQINTSITNPQDAKYNMTCENSNTKTVSLKDNPVQWGLYSGGTEELRLIPASDIPFTAASVVEWGQHSAIVEANPTADTGIDATSVVAHLGESTSAEITLVQTKSSVKGGATKYNYTVNFGDAIDFADAASNGAMLTLEWKKDETVKAMSNVIVPKIIATSATMSSLMATDAPWSTAEVHVLPGVTLEANAGDFSSKDVVINQLEIYPGATVKVTKGAQDVGTLKVKTLVLRNGWTRVGSKSYDVARLYVPTDANLQKSAVGDVWYSDWYIDYDQYYPIAVPFPVATSSISYKNASSAASAGVKLRYYSGKLRAANIQENQDQNWVEYTWGGTMPTNLEPSHGYIMTARRPTGKAFSIVRMPLTFSNDWAALGEKGIVGETHKDTVYVKAWGDESTPSYAKGWNIIANPYMSLHQGELSYDDETDDVIQYANIPDINFKEYDQLPIDATKLKPSSAFLVQAPKDGTVTFGTANRKAAAPSYRQNMQAETYPRQKAYIVLASEDAEDMMGIWISDKYSAEYEINADLEKLMGDGKSLRTYMHWNEMKMAYLAINKELAQQYIPVSVRIETEGEHIFSMHSASKISELKSVYLIDFETGAVTNLLESSYPFYSTAGTINDRFAINALVEPRDLPTELDIVRDGNDGTGPIKFIYHDKVFILHEGVIYDSTGKRVREIKK